VDDPASLWRVVAVSCFVAITFGLILRECRRNWAHGRLVFHKALWGSKSIADDRLFFGFITLALLVLEVGTVLQFLASKSVH
jgi:hypothetical protein